MKLFYLFLLVIFVIKIAGSNLLVKSTPAAADPSTNVKYHGRVRYWTMVDPGGKTYVSLNALKDAVNGSAKLLFPKEKTAAQILSDLTLFSPTDAEDECKKDTTKMEFKLAFDNENWIHGEVIVELKKLMVYLYAKCPGVDGKRPYATNPIEKKEANLENKEGRLCFQSENPFQSYNASNKNMMELQVSGTFKCKVFLIMPTYMDIEDEVLPPDFREPINSTFAAQGEEFWWKSGNNESLSDGIAFLGRDVVINITESTKSLPYYLRIGNNQPYPSLQLIFDSSCSNLQFDLFVNLWDIDDCRITVKFVDDGFHVTTKSGTAAITNGTQSLTLIFARGESKVYFKAGLSIIPMEVCQIENAPDVPSDQFVLQISPSDISCNDAQIIIPAGDVKNKIEVLLDRVKAAALISKFYDSTLTSSTANVTSPYSTSAGETTDISKGTFPWWWILAGVLLFVGIAVAIIVICYCVYHRRKQTKGKTNNDEETQHLTPNTETIVLVEESNPKKKKSKKETKETEVGESKKSTRKTVKNLYEEIPTSPPKQGPPKASLYEELPAIPPNQGPPPSSAATEDNNDPSIVQTAPTQNPTLLGNPAEQTRTSQHVSTNYLSA